MKRLLALFVLFSSAVGALAQQERCLQSEFSGEAQQGTPFSRDLGAGITFSVIPMRLREDERMGWFQIRVLGAEETGFALNASDRNWLLADGDVWSALIGGADSNLVTALQYRSRYLLFPMSVKDKEKAMQATTKMSSATSRAEMNEGLALLKSASMGHLRFELTDFGFGSGDPPQSVEWVTFNATVTLPANALDTDATSSAAVDCPTIPPETLENIRNTKRHEYPRVD